jgi:putative intracellular protease/amidase
MVKKFVVVPGILLAAVVALALALPTILHKAGLHPAYTGETVQLHGKRALIITTSHGVLGLIRARDRDGNLLIAGRRMTGVSDKQIRELGIEITPQHPETELRKAGARYESRTAFRDIFATLVVVDDEKRFVTGQNQNSGRETAHTMMAIAAGSR